MKINILLLSVLLGLAQLLNAQTKTPNVKWYEPAANTVKVGFFNDFASSEQKTADGNRMVVTYEKGSKYNLNLTSVYAATKVEKMGDNIEDRFLKLIAYQAEYYKTKTGASLPPVKTSLSSLTGQSGFATSFEIEEYTYQYRVIVLDNVFYLLSASYPTVNKNDKAVSTFFNSFAIVEAPKPIDDNKMD